MKISEKEIAAAIQVNHKPIKKLSDHLSKIMTDIYDNRKNYLKRNEYGKITHVDFRIGTFDRILSTCTLSLFYCSSSSIFLKRGDWEDIYLRYDLPVFYKAVKPGHLGHLRGFSSLLRFLLFQQAYSNIEASLRRISTLISLGKKGKNIFPKVNKLTGYWDDDFVNFISAIRNTIHHNGFFIPDWENPKPLKYKLKGADAFDFQLNRPIKINTEEVCIIIREMVNRLKLTFEHEKIKSLLFTLDINGKGYQEELLFI